MAWYEESGPDKKYVYNDIIAWSITASGECSWWFNKKSNAAEVIQNYGFLSLSVKKILEEYDSFGSYRGYVSFCRGEIRDKVKKIMQNKRKKEMAFQRLKNNTAIITYINHYKYKPKSNGMMKAKNNFENMVLNQ